VRQTTRLARGFDRAVGGYVDLDAPDAAASLERLCGRSDGFPVLTKVQSVACHQAARRKPDVVVRLGGRDTACGSSAEIIACAGPSGLVELNLRDWSFLGADSRHFLGDPTQPTKDLFLTLLHETGHWLGLRHSGRGGDIMDRTLTASSCLGVATMEDLGRVSDLGEGRRLGGEGALLGER
jgi:hypothetical protein